MPAVLACGRYADRVGFFQRALAHSATAGLAAQSAPIFYDLDATPILEDDRTAETAAMALPSKKNSPVPIGMSTDAGASAVSKQSRFLVDLGDAGSDEASAERYRFPIDGQQPELVGSTLGREFDFATFAVG